MAFQKSLPGDKSILVAKLERFLPIISFFGGVVGLLVLASISIPVADQSEPHIFEFAAAHTEVSRDQVRLIMQVVVSLVFMGAVLFVILSKRYKKEDQNWAYGTLGLIIGFWLNLKA